MMATQMCGMDFFYIYVRKKYIKTEYFSKTSRFFTLLLYIYLQIYLKQLEQLSEGCSLP